ncbi:hypothetical protein [Azonexus sp. IMCC34839]|uniref:hypothetical protein n=1 Tax=Azonexus sp. IMCC34839 TaxID=3133695 RepID=UPI00399BA803
MADTRPSPVSFFSACRLCVLLLFAPARLIAEQEQDAKERSNYTTSVEREHSAYIVRRAFLYSLILVTLSGAIGYGAGFLAGALVCCATTKLIAWQQIAGACLLLWGTLFIRGWEIQSYCGVTFVERVNQWLYRFLYCAGTAVLVCSLAWPQCNS